MSQPWIDAKPYDWSATVSVAALASEDACAPVITPPPCAESTLHPCFAHGAGTDCLPVTGCLPVSAPHRLSVVKIEIQLKYVHPSLAQKTKRTPLSVRTYKLSHLSF